MLSISFFSCSKNEVEKAHEKTLFLDCDEGMTSQIDTVKEYIIGKYDWVYTFHRTRLSSGYSTPESSNTTLSYIFKDDTKVEQYVNDVLSKIYEYEIKPEIVFLDNGETREEGAKIYLYERQGQDRKLKNVMFSSICNDSATFIIIDSQTIMMQFGRKSM